MSDLLKSGDDAGAPETQLHFSAGRAISWAVFLGCSWTWCIGMFLPVLLVRDLGFWGWVAFALPNVVGAAAMGWVLKTREASRRIVHTHAGACQAFSAVTIAFHVFFLLWFVPRLVGLPPAACTFALTAIYLLATMRRGRLDPTAAALVWAVSLILFGLFLTRQQPVTIPLDGAFSANNILWLTPVCIFGFLLCPYLDLTFHRARQETSKGEARLAFGVGFGICFLAMIVFSLCYATALNPLLSPEWRQHLRPAFGAIIATHMIVQAAFTLAVHTRSVVHSKITPRGVLGLLVLCQGALLLGLAGNRLPGQFGLDFGEVVYRLFMAFYGLVFPGYVWVCMIPRRGLTGTPTAASVRALLLGIIVAGPMYWMGFIQQRMIWLLPGLAAVLLARYAVPRTQATRKTALDPIA